MRVFAALALPEEVADHLDLALGQMRTGPGERVRWMPREHWHITTAFYGDLPDGAVPELAEQLGKVAATSPAMALRLSGAGSFQSRTLWMAVAGQDRADEAALVALMRSCALLTDPWDTERDRRRAHLTVARTGRRSAGGEPAALARALSVYRGPTWHADSVHLYASELGAGPGGGPRYQRLTSADLEPT